MIFRPMFVYIFSVFPLVFFIQFGHTVSLSDLDLVFVQSVWRHGDRTPQSKPKNDIIRDEDWESVGAKVKEDDERTGVITRKGLEQHFELGKEIRRRYIEETFNFLPKQREEAIKNIVIHSTNRKRTILSAMSNVFGMYSDNEQLPQDFSSSQYSDSKLFPIEISKDYLNDCVGNIQCRCPRRTELQRIAHKQSEYQEFITSSEFVELTANLTKYTGHHINDENFWKVVDTLNCERIHFLDRVMKEYDWYSEELFDKVTKINYQFNKFTSGIYGGESAKVGQEIRKIRVGPITNTVYNRMEDKLECIKNPRCTDLFVQNLKYHGYSAHDMTIYSLLNGLGIEKYSGDEDGEWPDYAASLFIELFVDKDNNPYFRIVYKANESSTFQSLTEFIPDCDEQEFCPLQVFEKISKFYSLENGKDINSYCQELPSPELSSSPINTISSSTKSTKSIDIPVILLASAIAIILQGFIF